MPRQVSQWLAAPAVSKAVSLEDESELLQCIVSLSTVEVDESYLKTKIDDYTKVEKFSLLIYRNNV